MTEVYKNKHKAADVRERLDEHTVRAVLQSLGVEKLHSYGNNNWLASAPYRIDKHPSLSVSRADGAWNDKASGERGSIFDLVMMSTGCEFAEAVQLVANAAGMITPCATTETTSTITPATYRYVDEVGRPLYVIKRTADKKFYPTQLNGSTGYGARRVLYRLNEVVASAEADRWVLLVEGEKDADSASAAGFIATTSPGGANGWQPEYAESLRDRKVAIIPDNDKPGHQYALKAAASLHGVAADVRVVELPGLGPRLDKHGLDLSDWLDQGNRPDRLKRLVQNSPRFTPGQTDAQPAVLLPQAVTKSLCEYQPEGITWLWRGWLASKKVTIYAGVEGDGKSYSLSDIIARLTDDNATMPDGQYPLSVCNILLLIAEDGISDTVRPRLERHGADIARITVLEAVSEPNGSAVMFNIGKHLPVLEEAIRQHEIDVVVIDPLSSFLQRADRNDEGSVRDLLTPLVALAERTGVAIIGVAHMNRPNGTSRRATQRILGSTAFGAVARLVWMIAPKDDPDDPNRRVFGVVKSNIGMRPPSLEWSIPAEDAVVEWHGESDISISELIEGSRSSGSTVSPERQDIINLLADAQDGMTPDDVALKLGKNPSTVRTLLTKMTTDRQVVRVRTGVYGVVGRRQVDSVDSVDADPPGEEELSTLSTGSTGLWPSTGVDVLTIDDDDICVACATTGDGRIVPVPLGESLCAECQAAGIPF